MKEQTQFGTKTWRAQILAVCFACAATSGFADAIATFDFAGLAGSEATATNNFKNANLEDVVISRSPSMPSVAGNGDRFNSTNWAVGSIANAVTSNRYMEFTITPTAGYRFAVTSIVVKWQRSSTGNSAVSLRSSTDSYASDLDSVWTLADATATQTNTFTFNQTNSASGVTYRFYGYSEAVTGTGGPGDGAGDDIVINGTVEEIPDTITFYARVPDWADHNPGNPAIWGPYPGPGWSGYTMTSNSGWWSVQVEVPDASAEITYQLRFSQSGTWKYQKATGNFGADPTFTTTTGEIWIYAADNGDFTWSGDDYFLASGTVTEGDPTRVVLFGFQVAEQDGQVVVGWETASEENTVGFYVERLVGSAWVRVNEEMVVAGSPMGASYSIVDAGAQAAEIYQYRLVEIEADGSVETYGPFERSTSFAFRSPVEFGENGATIRWLSREGEVYEILRSKDLTKGFEKIEQGVAATPPENEYVDGDAGSVGMYVIRVVSE